MGYQQTAGTVHDERTGGWAVQSLGILVSTEFHCPRDKQFWPITSHHPTSSEAESFPSKPVYHRNMVCVDSCSTC
jgi:hypothetical protein